MQLVVLKTSDDLICKLLVTCILHVCDVMQVDIQSPWWIEALQSVVTRGMETDLCFRIKDELSSTDMDLGSIGRSVKPSLTCSLTVCRPCICTLKC